MFFLLFFSFLFLIDKNARHLYDKEKQLSLSLCISPSLCWCVCVRPNLDTLYSLTKIHMVWGLLLQQGIKTYVVLDSYILNRQIMWHFVKEEECLDSKMHKKIYVDRMANRLNSWHPKVSKELPTSNTMFPLDAGIPPWSLLYFTWGSSSTSHSCSHLTIISSKWLFLCMQSTVLVAPAFLKLPSIYLGKSVTWQ